MSSGRKLLLAGGLVLALVGMAYGLWYAVFLEHQTLDAIGGSLTSAFVHGARGDRTSAMWAIDEYAASAYVYVRRVDAHSHWIGLAMLLLMVGVAFDHIKRILADLLPEDGQTLVPDLSHRHGSGPPRERDLSTGL